MAKIDFGGVIENVVTRDEFPLSKAREVLKMKLWPSLATVFRDLHRLRI
jgi:hypothetical protein